MSISNGVICIGLAVVKMIVKLTAKDDVVKVTDGAVNITEKTLSVIDKRKGERELNSIADRISEFCEQLMTNASISDTRQEAIVEDLLCLLNRAEPSTDLVVTKRADERAIQRLLREMGDPVFAQYDEKERDLCDRMLSYIAKVVTEVTMETLRFSNVSALHQLELLDELKNLVQDILDRVREVERAVLARNPEGKRYETQYRSNVIHRYNSIHLLGANLLTRESSKYPIDVGYVTLELSDHSSTISIQAAVKKYRTIWLRGEAGSGKSTLLQWLAVNSARNNQDLLGDDSDCLPILVELRNADPEALSLRGFVEKLMADEDLHAPEGWLTDLLSAGKVILLIDGVDEVKRESRQIFFEWIEELREKYKSIKIIITSRPQVKQRISVPHTVVSVLPMIPQKVDQFIDYWHSAVLVQNLKMTPEEAEKYKERLQASLLQNEPIRRIASNPLICAMICALHFQNGALLSSNKNGLYEDCCKMLLSDRDEVRGVPAYADLSLNYAEKKSILAKFAYWVMKNGVSDATEECFCRIISNALRSFDSAKKTLSADSICVYFVERSGLLQVVEVDHLDFIHRSFLEYLTAYQISEEEDWGFLLHNLDDDSWLETTVLTMGFAPARRAERFLRDILARAEPRYYVIAATCAANAVSLPEQLRGEINERLSAIIPPPNPSACAELAKVGNAVTPFLRYNRKYSDQQKWDCLNTLFQINSGQALRTAFSYLVPSASEKTVDTLGSKLSFYTHQEIQAADIAAPIRAYIRRMSSSGRMVISEAFFRCLSEKDQKDLEPALAKVHQLTLRNVDSDISPNVYRPFTKCMMLTAVGSFRYPVLLQTLGEQLKFLSLCSSNPEFDIYALNDLPLHPERFVLHTNAPLYFSGADLQFLQQVEELALYLYHPKAELDFHSFKELKSLKKLSLFQTFPFHDLVELLRQFPKLELQLYTANESDRIASCRGIMDVAFFDFDAKVEVKCFHFPYGDLTAQGS